jgi:type IV pilus assembly protein PilN
MIRINLLPHREAKRKQKQTAFVALLALGGLLGGALVLMVGGYNASHIAIQNQRNEVLKSANAELDTKISKIASLKA